MKIKPENQGMQDRDHFRAPQEVRNATGRQSGGESDKHQIEKKKPGHDRNHRGGGSRKGQKTVRLLPEGGALNSGPKLKKSSKAWTSNRKSICCDPAPCRSIGGKGISDPGHRKEKSLVREQSGTKGEQH